MNKSVEYGQMAQYYDLFYKNKNYSAEIDFIKNFINTDDCKILDAGCGTGNHALLLYKNRYDVAGFDLIKRIKANTHIIVGLADNEKHINNSKKLYEMLTCKKQLHLLPNVPHDLANTPETKETFEKALDEILSSCQRYKAKEDEKIKHVL